MLTGKETAIPFVEGVSIITLTGTDTPAPLPPDSTNRLSGGETPTEFPPDPSTVTVDAALPTFSSPVPGAMALTTKWPAPPAGMATEDGVPIIAGD